MQVIQHVFCLHVGADGANSTVRMGMMSHAPMFGFSQVCSPAATLPVPASGEMHYDCFFAVIPHFSCP